MGRFCAGKFPQICLAEIASLCVGDRQLVDIQQLLKIVVNGEIVLEFDSRRAFHRFVQFRIQQIFMNDAFLQNITFASVMQSLWRQKFKALLFALLLMTLVVVTLILTPKKYESVGKLFVQVGRGGVTLDPTATTSETISVLESRDSEINSVIDVLQSRGVLELVLEQDNLEEEILKTSSIFENIEFPKIPLISTPDGDEQYENFKRRDRAVKKFQDALSVRTPRKAATITIACHTESAELSKKLVEVLIETYIEQHVKARIIGLVLFLCGLAIPFQLVMSKILQNDSRGRAARSVAVIFLWMALWGLLNSSFSGPLSTSSITFWIIVGLAIGRLRGSDQDLTNCAVSR